ncbi:hypothetical protein [Ancylobacter sp. 3268]|nr:hypothetical protein [Ancylobacter sp. 3268]
MAPHPYADPPENDAIEIWGRRIGRGLAVVCGLGFGVYLIVTYLR